jgi:hypothetical protein
MPEQNRPCAKCQCARCRHYGTICTRTEDNATCYGIFDCADFRPQVSVADLDAEATRILTEVVPPEMGLPDGVRSRWLAIEVFAHGAGDARMERHAKLARRYMDAEHIA